MAEVDRSELPRRVWFATHSTHIKSANLPLDELKDKEKKGVSRLALLSACVVEETKDCFVIADAALDYMPLAPQLKYIVKSHWSWPPPEEWIARRPAHITASDVQPDSAEADKMLVPAGSRLYGRIAEETPAFWKVKEAALRNKAASPHMRYIAKADWRLRPPPKLYTPEAPLGYYYNNGGLNNQRLALLGLFLRAKEWKRAIVLPEMSIKNIAADSQLPAPLQDFFDLPRLLDFAQRHGIDVSLDDPANLPTGGWDYFAHGAGQFSRRGQQPEQFELESDLVIDFIRSVVPIPRTADVVARLKKRIFSEEGIELAAQFRIESDWAEHSKHLHSRIKEREDFFIPYDAIIAKIAATLPEQKKILVICDEMAVETPKEEMRAVCLARYGIELFFKSDFLSGEETETLDFLARAMIDFELAAGARHFVGLTRSTFSNLVTFQKFALSGQPVKTDYIYNNDKPELGLRTDNGGWDSPRRAVL